MNQTTTGKFPRSVIGVIFFVLVQFMILCLVPATAQEGLKTDKGNQLTGPLTLVYVSDYFSFIGEDDHGHMAFALDNNRGRDGKDYQAEHFVVLHDEQQGWIEVVGNGAYKNANKELLSIPGSDFFRFEGTPRSGMTITSPTNSLTLRIEPIPKHLTRTHGQSEFWMGSAPAVLEWEDRTLEGRVIYEYLYMPDFNRLTRTYFSLWDDFQGFYVSMEGKGDFYLHGQQSKKFAALVGNQVGFAVFDDQVDKVENVELDVLHRKLTLGFYRWPTEWQLTWTGEEGSGSMRFKLLDRNVIANWIIGGFAMGIIKGQIIYNGRRWPFYGLAELIM